MSGSSSAPSSVDDAVSGKASGAPRVPPVRRSTLFFAIALTVVIASPALGQSDVDMVALDVSVDGLYVEPGVSANTSALNSSITRAGNNGVRLMVVLLDQDPGGGAVAFADAVLDRVFSALADPTRRHVLESLGQGNLAVSELAEPHGMSLPGFMKHLRVLEDAGLIAREKEGRVVSCELSAAPMQAAAAWMSRYEKFWTDKLDSLARYLYQQEELQSWRSKRSPSSTSTGSIRSRRKRSTGRGPTRKR